MVHKRVLRLVIVIVACIPHLAVAIRHSKIKRAERFELRKIAAQSSEARLSDVLGKQAKVMTFDEAVLAKDYYTKQNEKEMIVKCGQRILAVGGADKDKTDITQVQEILRTTRLQLAEIFIDQEKYEEAIEHSEKYLTFYPGASETKRVQFLAIKANYLGKLPSDRDQKKTLATIKLAEEFLEQHTTDTEFKSEIEEMMHQSYQTLIRSEMNIINVHLNTFNNSGNKDVLMGAEMRLKDIKEKYLKHVPLAQKRVDELELRLAKAANKPLPVQKQEPIHLASAPPQKSSWLSSVKSVFVEDNAQYFA